MEALQKEACVVWHESTVLKCSSFSPDAVPPSIYLSISSPPTETYVPIYCSNIKSDQVQQYLCVLSQGVRFYGNGGTEIETLGLKLWSFAAAFDHRHNLKLSADNSYVRHKSPCKEKSTALVCTYKKYADKHSKYNSFITTPQWARNIWEIKSLVSHNPLLHIFKAFLFTVAKIFHLLINIQHVKTKQA